MTAPPPPPLPIAHDLLCIRCQYNLRTRTPADRCPECGLDIRDSIAHHHRFGSALAHPRLFRLGAWILALPCLLAPLAILLTHGTRTYADAFPAGTSLLVEVLSGRVGHLLFVVSLITGVALITSSVGPLIAPRSSRSALVLLSLLYGGISLLQAAAIVAILPRALTRPFAFRTLGWLIRNENLTNAIACVMFAATGWILMRQVARSLAAQQLARLTPWAFGSQVFFAAAALAVQLFMGAWRPWRVNPNFPTVYLSIELLWTVVAVGFGCYWLLVARAVSERSSPLQPIKEIATSKPPAPAVAKVQTFLAPKNQELRI